MKIEKIISKILIDYWDPISAKDLESPNEYDGYALRIVGMLYNGTSEKKVASYLDSVKTEEFGLRASGEASKIAAAKICALEIKRPYKK